MYLHLPTAAPLPPAHARTVSNIPPPDPQLYVYRRNPTPQDNTYFTIPFRATEDEKPYPLINNYIISPDPYSLTYSPPLDVHLQEEKECVAAEIASFQSYLDTHPSFSPDVPVACHYGTQHLVILFRNGSLFFVQDYKTTFSLPQSERVERMFTLSMPSEGAESWNLAVHDDIAYVTTVSSPLESAVDS
jgi:hypothetical protein